MIVGLLAHSTAVFGVALMTIGAATPVILLSFLVRLVVGIVNEGRGRRPAP